MAATMWNLFSLHDYIESLLVTSVETFTQKKIKVAAACDCHLGFYRNLKIEIS
jgi:hypothetical protein